MRIFSKLVLFAAIKPNSMKKIILSIALACSTGAFAGPLHLVFLTADGQEHAFVAESLQMTRNETLLEVKNAEKSESFNLTDLRKMYFTENPAAIAEIDAGMLEGEVTVYTLNGTEAGHFSSATEAISQLEPGIYVMSTEKQTVKIRVK